MGHLQLKFWSRWGTERSYNRITNSSWAFRGDSTLHNRAKWKGQTWLWTCAVSQGHSNSGHSRQRTHPLLRGSALPAAALGRSQHGCECSTGELRAKCHTGKWKWFILKLCPAAFFCWWIILPASPLTPPWEDPDLKCQRAGVFERTNARRKICHETGSILGIQKVMPWQLLWSCTFVPSLHFSKASSNNLTLGLFLLLSCCSLRL